MAGCSGGWSLFGGGSSLFLNVFFCGEHGKSCFNNRMTGCKEHFFKQDKSEQLHTTYKLLFPLFSFGGCVENLPRLDIPLQDIEWARDGDDGKLYIVQARPETVASQKKVGIIEEYKMLEKGTLDDLEFDCLESKFSILQNDGYAAMAVYGCKKNADLQMDDFNSEYDSFVWFVGCPIFSDITLLMEEILHHLGCIKPCK